MAASRQIIDLRQLLAERFARPVLPAHEPRPSGIPALDQITNGGLRKGVITEVTSAQPSAGSALLVHALLHWAKENRCFLALIDGRDSFDPQTAGPARLRHLLWIRCRQASEALKAADLLLRDGNFPLVILDLVLNPVEELRRIPASNWYRLQRLVEPAPTAFLVISRHHLVASAQDQIVLANQWQLGDLARDDAISALQMQARRTQFSALETALG